MYLAISSPPRSPAFLYRPHEYFYISYHMQRVITRQAHPPKGLDTPKIFCQQAGSCAIIIPITEHIGGRKKAAAGLRRFRPGSRMQESAGDMVMVRRESQGVPFERFYRKIQDPHQDIHLLPAVHGNTIYRFNFSGKPHYPGLRGAECGGQYGGDHAVYRESGKGFSGDVREQHHGPLLQRMRGYAGERGDRQTVYRVHPCRMQLPL